MPIDFSSLLTADQKRDILTQRLQQFAVEAYQHEINRQLAVKINSEQGVAQAEEALAALETAIVLHQEELATIEPATTPAE